MKILHEIEERVEHIESELSNLKSKLPILENREKQIKAAKEWLLLTKNAKDKRATNSPSSIEISRLGRQHG